MPVPKLKMARSGPSPRFEMLNDDELAELLDDADAKSTKKTIKFGFSKLDSFAKLKDVNLLDISARVREDASQLDSLLALFFAATGFVQLLASCSYSLLASFYAGFVLCVVHIHN